MKLWKVIIPYKHRSITACVWFIGRQSCRSKLAQALRLYSELLRANCGTTQPVYNYRRAERVLPRA